MEKEFSLEEAIAEIRKIVDQMQKGVADFDTQKQLFQRGSTLIKEAQQFLDKTELDIQQLIDGKLEPFDEN